MRFSPRHKFTGLGLPMLSRSEHSRYLDMFRPVPLGTVLFSVVLHLRAFRWFWLHDLRFLGACSYMSKGILGKWTTRVSHFASVGAREVPRAE